MNGTIFDIRRFSTHDGEGIRTTVFLKGCPLNCIWCQNPEGISTKRRPIHFRNRCIKCGICVKLAKNNGVVFEDGNIKLNVDREENWKELIDNCPSRALMMDSQIQTVDEVIKEVMRDKVFFKHGGGITLSGGEPLVQSKFAIELLKELKKLNVNTAIETALNIGTEVIKEVLPYLDIIYADFKIFDDNDHKKYVGVSNIKIKNNIKFLLQSEKKQNVIIRTPMIPGYTTSEKNIAEISRYISGIYADVSYEILNYNPLAEAKYPLVDKEYCFKERHQLYSKEEMKRFGSVAKNNGIKNLIIES
ncbi:glycyl-radical enzyme activating protein [Clostridium guangxiense]|uniref:glycyl-radical enzyme activating protein n=1 Tax=Clostridium guangxiense TaxID=1662055 RepID=UPI001E456B12|nr:glycyl-radical enzyme activating protein [Clostridium guangxiense]MCD2348639.1 glycyl-radical enzyme activating protein [Clostridium guangxiense]